MNWISLFTGDETFEAVQERNEDTCNQTENTNEITDATTLPDVATGQSSRTEKEIPKSKSSPKQAKKTRKRRHDDAFGMLIIYINCKADCCKINLKSINQH